MNPQPDPQGLIDFGEFIFTTIFNQINQADMKAFGILTVIGIITAALVDRLNSLRASIGHPLWVVIFSVSFVAVLVSTKAILRIIYPRMTKKPGKSMTYFRDIASLSREEYVHKGEALDDAAVIRELYDNTYDLAKISEAKYKVLRQAIIITSISLIWTIAVLLFS